MEMTEEEVTTMRIYAADIERRDFLIVMLKAKNSADLFKKLLDLTGITRDAFKQKQEMMSRHEP